MTPEELTARVLSGQLSANDARQHIGVSMSQAAQAFAVMARSMNAAGATFARINNHGRDKTKLNAGWSDPARTKQLEDGIAELYARVQQLEQGQQT